ncbi:MAG: diguanylate cyclase [Lachnospiraceae bacterium]|nr:diguanylate cyclase [Lachnospiraceae bacterium]
MKLTKINRGGKQSLYGTFLTMTLLPLLLFGLITTVYSSLSLRNSMIEQAHGDLQNVADAIQVMYDAVYAGDFNVLVSEEETLLYKGETQLSGDYSLIDAMKEKTGLEISLFFYDNRLLTTITNAEGERYIGSGASETIMKTVYLAKEPHFFDNVSIGGTRYFAYYTPLIASDGTTCVGMIGVARKAEILHSVINRGVYQYLLIVIAALLVTAAFIAGFTNKIVLVLKKIMDFMKELADGFFYKTLDPIVMKRTDELGDLGKAMVKVQVALRRQIERDPLTGLFNRRSGEKRLDELQASRQPFALAIGDIDFFKKFNDNFGHDCGDEVLRTVARVLSDSMGKQGFVIRWGGEEFLLAFAESTAMTAGVKAGEILQKIRDTKVEYNGISHSVTMTFGVAEGDSDRPISEQINAADAKLYEGKEGGRNRVVV